MPIAEKDIREAVTTLNRYREGKAALEKRIIENEEWFKQRYWRAFKRDDGGKLPSSGYLFNTILNKHADAMDNYPTPTILPREKSDESTAEMLSKVVPAILERNLYAEVYSEMWWYKLKQGTGVQAVLWSPSEDDIIIKKTDLLNLFWEPGIIDIQKSENLFNVQLVNTTFLEAQYPDIDFGVKSNPGIEVQQYIHDDSVSTEGKSAVVDWYYKKVNNEGKTVLHLCKFVDDKLLFASENEESYSQTGFYAHGLYPFIFDKLFPDEGMPTGFGVIDANKDAQESIDEMDSNIQFNLRANAKTRYAVKAGSGINEGELTDTSKEIVHYTSGIASDVIAQVPVQVLDAAMVGYRDKKIEELKETSGNREFNQGATAGGVTAASAIAQLQEAGNKLSRDSINSSYSAFSNVCRLIIELIRQFYDEKRVFRITEANGVNDFIEFDNEGLKPKSLGTVQGLELGEREPFFDIKISAQKKSPFNQISHNQFVIQLFQEGFFAPNMIDQSISAINLMEFDGKDAMLRELGEIQQRNGTVQVLQGQINQMAEIISQLTGQPLDPSGQNEEIMEGIGNG